jgi:ABC-2 type transport system permease protein
VKVKRLISLILIKFDQHYGISKTKYSIKRNKSDLITFIVIFCALVPTVVVYSFLYLNMLKTTLETYTILNIQPLFLANFFVLAGFFGFFLGAFLLIGELFINKDMKLLLTLPLKPYEVILGKLSMILSDQMFISLILLLPSLIYFGVYTKQNFLYYLIFIIIFLFSQVFPMTVVLLYTLFTSKLFKKSNRRELLLYLSTIFLMVIFGLYLFLSGSTFSINMENQNEIPNISINPDSTITKVAWLYPPAFLAVKSLTSGIFLNLVWLLLFLGFHLSLLILTLYIGEKLYFSNYSSLIESKPLLRKSKTQENSYFFTKESTLEKALLKREWLYFLKTPSFSVNGFSNVLAFPIILIVFGIIINNVELGLSNEIISTILQYKLFIVGFIATLASSINGLSYSCFSREGNLIKELKIIPVKVDQILRAKIKHIMQISSLGLISGLIIGTFLFKLNLYEFCGAMILAIIFNLFLNIIQMIIDASKPYLNWDNPQKAMKQNINGLLAVLLVFGVVAIMGFLIYKLVPLFDQYIILIILNLIFLIFSFFLWRYLKRKTVQLLSREL